MSCDVHRHAEEHEGTQRSVLVEERVLSGACSPPYQRAGEKDPSERDTINTMGREA